MCNTVPHTLQALIYSFKQPLYSVNRAEAPSGASTGGRSGLITWSSSVLGKVLHFYGYLNLSHGTFVFDTIPTMD